MENCKLENKKVFFGNKFAAVSPVLTKIGTEMNHVTAIACQ